MRVPIDRSVLTGWALPTAPAALGASTDVRATSLKPPAAPLTVLGGSVVPFTVRNVSGVAARRPVVTIVLSKDKRRDGRDAWSPRGCSCRGRRSRSASRPVSRRRDSSVSSSAARTRRSSAGRSCGARVCASMRPYSAATGSACRRRAYGSRHRPATSRPRPIHVPRNPCASVPTRSWRRSILRHEGLDEGRPALRPHGAGPRLQGRHPAPPPDGPSAAHHHSPFPPATACRAARFRGRRVRSCAERGDRGRAAAGHLPDDGGNEQLLGSTDNFHGSMLKIFAIGTATLKLKA